LFIVCQILGARAGCILSVVWNKDRERQGLPSPTSHDATNAVKTAVEAVRILIEQERAI
jgi:uridine phosphorylase